MLDDPVTAQYTHTLTVTGRWEGRYTCAVANDISENSTELDIRCKTECCLCYIHSSFSLFQLPTLPMN